MRFFIALEIPDQSRKELEVIQQKLQAVIPEANLTDLNKLHLTIAFVGEQAESLKEDLIDLIKKATEAMAPFEVIPAYLDGFPNIHSPHTIWVGIKGDIDKLFVLRERIKDGLTYLKLDVDERRFIPHIAIAKVSNFQITGEQEDRLEELIAQHFSPIKVTSVKLFESIPDRGLHSHNTLADIPLEG
jgi:RNA 2',3'-cyclic 3'-phosphodiesterase